MPHTFDCGRPSCYGCSLARGVRLRLKPAEAAIAKLSDDTPLTEDQAATLLGIAQAAGIPAAEAYPTLRALALADKLRP